MQLMNNKIYQERRNALAKKIFAKSGGGIAIISTAPELARNRDSEFPYRHDSDFFYLTGFEEPGSTLVMEIKSSGKNCELQSHLFCRPIPEKVSFSAPIDESSLTTVFWR